MPLKNFKNIGELQRYEYQRGKITGVNTENDTCNLTLKEAVLSGEEITYNDKTYSNVPIYYHCNPDVEEQANGSLKGAGAAFMEDDDVVVLIERGKDAEKIFVVARIGEKRHCSIGMVVIISTQSEMEAFAWDITNNKLVVATTTLARVRSQLGKTGVELVPSGSEVDTWTPRPFPSEHDAVLNLPNLVYGDYSSEGFQYIDTVPLPATPTYTWYGGISQWVFTHHYLSNPFDATAEIRAPYMMLLYGQADGSAIDEFEELTGITWPPFIDNGYGEPLRQLIFWHTVFGYPMAGNQAVLENLQVSMEQFFDTWAEAIWTPPPEGQLVELVRPSVQWKSSGIAKINNAAVLFEHAGVCMAWDIPTTQCSSSEWYKSLLRMYIRNDDILSAGLAKSCFDAVNFERAALAIPELVLNRSLVKAAERHLADLIDMFPDIVAVNGLLPHTGSDSSTPFTRATEADYNLWMHNAQSYSIGENLNYNGDDSNPVSAAIEGWRASTAGHWEMLTNQDMKETGLAAASTVIINGLGESVTYYLFVQVFGWRDEIWAGFSPVDTTEMKAYMEETFTFTNEGDNTRVPKVYLT